MIFRTLVQSGETPILMATEAIIKCDKHDLLHRFVTEAKGVEIIDGNIVHDGDLVIPVFDYAVQRRALRCATMLLKMGLRTVRTEVEALLKIAFSEDSREAVDELLGEVCDPDTMAALLLEAADRGSVHGCRAVWKRIKSADNKNGKVNSGFTGDDSIELPSLAQSEEVVDQEGNTALHVAARSGARAAREVMELLLSLRPQLLEAENRSKRTPVHEAAEGEIFK